MGSELLWSPSEERKNNSQMQKFLIRIAKEYQLENKDYLSLHKWSVENPGIFWKEIIGEFKLIGNGFDEDHNALSFLDYPWFPKATLNFAENLLQHKNSERIALNSIHESGSLREMTYKDLYSEVSKVQKYFKEFVGKGDIVACYMPHIAETIVSMLATTSLGGVFTSTSCDFGVQGVLDRFGQTEPKVLVTVTGYTYNGKYFDLTPKIKEIKEKIPSIERVILVDFLGIQGEVDIDDSITYKELLETVAQEIKFTQVPFNHPLYIMYSSGTTGKPKCIVHSVGGTLVQHVKELGLHSDLNESKNIMYFTTCGWMMWNWLVSSLYFGATITLYEGSPAKPSLKEFIHIIDREKINIYGTSPKFLRALEDSLGADLASEFESLETILSTGAPLLAEQFDYVYKAFKKDLMLGSICGGTDIVGCFMLGNPILPVHRGEIQCLGLGMDVSAFSSQAKELKGEQAELVCKKPFISQPIGFWKDNNKEKFKKAYFSVFENIWHHGDFITLTENGGVKVHGRSDATLNPGGVRIGTAEIYRQTEKLEYLEDSICVGEQFDGDVRVVLFVKLKDGEELTDNRVKEIRDHIKINTTPRHMPQVVQSVTGIPYTRSGKKMEVAVTRLINGDELTNLEAVMNPDCLDQYKKYHA